LQGFFQKLIICKGKVKNFIGTQTTHALTNQREGKKKEFFDQLSARNRLFGSN